MQHSEISNYPLDHPWFYGIHTILAWYTRNIFDISRSLIFCVFSPQIKFLKQPVHLGWNCIIIRPSLKLYEDFYSLKKNLIRTKIDFQQLNVYQLYFPSLANLQFFKWKWSYSFVLHLCFFSPKEIWKNKWARLRKCCPTHSEFLNEMVSRFVREIFLFLLPL